MEDPNHDSVGCAAAILSSLATDERVALRRFAHDEGVDLPEAARMALRDWLTGHGYLESQADNDN
jgi:hypothetical protein